MPSMAAVRPASGSRCDQPFQRAHVRLGEGRLVHAGLVGADGTERIEIGKNAGAIGVRRECQACSATFNASVRISSTSRSFSATNSGVVLIL